MKPSLTPLLDRIFSRISSSLHNIIFQHNFLQKHFRNILCSPIQNRLPNKKSIQTERYKFKKNAQHMHGFNDKKREHSFARYLRRTYKFGIYYKSNGPTEGERWAIDNRDVPPLKNLPEQSLALLLPLSPVSSLLP